MKRNIVADIISILFILLFVYAAVSKLIDFEKFRVQLGQSPLLTAFAGWISWIVPTVEICIAFLLTTSRFRLAALYASFTLMTIFSAYIIAITKFSEFIPCSCGGVLQHLSWNQHLVFNIVFCIIAAAGVLINKNHSTEQFVNTIGTTCYKQALS